MANKVQFDKNGNLILKKISYKVKHDEEIEALLKKTKKIEDDNDI